MRFTNPILILLAALILLPVSIAGATDAVDNGDFFVPDLAGWISDGSVSGINGQAVLKDEDSLGNILFQRVGLSGGTYTLSFDFLLSLSDIEVEFSFPDTFFTTLYFTDDALFDPAACFDNPNLCENNISLFSADHNGQFDSSLNPLNILSPYKTSFSTTFKYIIPTFELYDGNFSSNSTVTIDNVSIAKVEAPPVPEPGTLVSLGIGLAGLIFAGRKRFLA
jgi:hypothetical protein